MFQNNNVYAPLGDGRHIDKNRVYAPPGVHTHIINCVNVCFKIIMCVCPSKYNVYVRARVGNQNNNVYVPRGGTLKQ